MADTEVGSPHGLARLEGIHHALDLRLTDCSYHFVQIVKILDGGDHRLADCQEQEDLVCQRLVACDDRHRHRNCQMQHFHFVQQKEVSRHLQMVEGWESGLVSVADQWPSDWGLERGLKSRTELVEVCYESQQASL